MGKQSGNSEIAESSGEFLEENRRARLNLIREAQTAMELLRRTEEKANDDGLESDKRGTGIPAG